MEARIAPGGREEIGLVNAAIVRVIGLAAGGRPPKVFTTLAHLTDNDYEWGHHERLGARAGIAPEEIERLRQGPRARSSSSPPSASATPRDGSAMRPGPASRPSATSRA